MRERAAAARRGHDIDLGDETGREDDTGLGRDTHFYREQTVARVRGGGHFADRGGKYTIRIRVEAHFGDVAECDTDDLTVGESGPHHMATSGRAQHHHRLAWRNELALFGQATQHAAVARRHDR